MLLAKNLLRRQLAHGSEGLSVTAAADHKNRANVDINQDTDPEQTHSPPFQPLAEPSGSISLSLPIVLSHPCGQSIPLAPALSQG